MARCYHQFCGVAKALDVVGERWTLLLVRDLLLGPRRYTDLLRGLPGITTNLLAQRLKDLVERGLVRKTTLSVPGEIEAYQLTERGRELEKVVLALGAFGATYLDAPGPDDQLNPRWAMVSLKRRYRQSSRGGAVQLEVGQQTFHARFGEPLLDIRDQAVWEPDVVLAGEPAAWFALLVRGAGLRDLVAKGQLERRGAARVAADFVRSVGARV